MIEQIFALSLSLNVIYGLCVVLSKVDGMDRGIANMDLNYVVQPSKIYTGVSYS